MESNFRVVIYESSSFGGNYRYAQELIEAYKRHQDVEFATLILPRNADAISETSKKILLNDQLQGSTLKKKLLFLLRTFFNPLFFLCWLTKQQPSIVIFNDFEQLSSPFWVPWFKLFARKHQFYIVLHDPDRDAYPPNRVISGFTMKCLLWLCRNALYHEYLPKKSYYTSSKVKFLSIPHGLYPQPTADSILLQQLNAKKESKILLSILGNIRVEKNYEQALRCLVDLPDCLLLIAGKPSNSTMNVDALKEMSLHLGVDDRVIWLVCYLTEAELTASIEATDICLLNYLPSFTSQSGLINMYAPFKKKVIISEIESGLSFLNKRFSFGAFCNPLDDQSFIEAVTNVRKQDYADFWSDYLQYASWDMQVNLVLNEIQNQ